MATIAIQSGSFSSPAAITYSSAAAGGDKFANAGSARFHVKNGGGSSITVTFLAGAANANECNFGVSGSSHAKVETVPAGSDRLFGPFQRERFNDTDGYVNVTYSGVTTVTVAALAL